VVRRKELGIKLLYCDRCGELMESPEDIEMALQGTASWHEFLREQGIEPRGLFACRNWIRCHGEMQAWDGKGKKPNGKPIKQTYYP
jgi:hypothetical protein